MRFFGETQIDFVSKRKTAFIISAIVILAGIVSLIINGGPKYSIDFTGGISLELDLNSENANAAKVTQDDLRSLLKKEGFEDATIQQSKNAEGKEFFIVKVKGTNDVGDKIVDTIKAKYPNNITKDLIRSQEHVGPKIGGELKTKALMAIFWSLLAIIIYIWFRFELTYGFAAVAALFHDVLITVGIFSLFGKEISLTIVAALLTIVGYSLNDTIVVFDRIREDLKVYRRESYESVINHSINETLSRTVITSLTTLLVVLALFFKGGTVIHDFAFALLVGVLVGTYSSIFIASPILIEYFNKRLQKKGIKRG
jgi:preprotein translocase SecF subunit